MGKKSLIPLCPTTMAPIQVTLTSCLLFKINANTGKSHINVHFGLESVLQFSLICFHSVPLHNY